MHRDDQATPATVVHIYSIIYRTNISERLHKLEGIA